MRQAVPQSSSEPMDVKLMNFTSAVLFIAFVIMVLGAIGVAAARMSVFALRGIVVHGDMSHNNAVTLRANVAPKLMGNFFTMDLQMARAAFEAVPWIRHAVVHREFPSSLRVELHEHVPAANWGNEGDTSLVNQQGEVFEANVGDAENERLPRLKGPLDQSKEVLSMYKAIQAELNTVDLEIKVLELSPRGSWVARLESNALIELGRGTVPEVTAVVRRFAKTLTQVASHYGLTVEALESADLRHQEGYALRLHGVSTVATVTGKGALAMPGNQPIKPAQAVTH